MRKMWKYLAAGSVSAALFISGSAVAQDASDFIRRMDTNGNGMIDPDESQGRSRSMLERMAQSNPRINLSRPIPIEMLTREMDRMRTGTVGGGQEGRGGGGGAGGFQGGGFGGGGFGGGGFGGGGFFGGPGGNQPGQTNGGNRQNGKDATGNPIPTLVEGFGNEYNDTKVLGFGIDEEETFSGVKPTDEDRNRMERTLRQNDRNNDGVIEGQEITAGRWDDGDPKLYDLNRDGRLTKSELTVRATKKRLADEAAAKAEQEQRGRDRDQRGGDRGGGRGGMAAMFGGGDFGGGRGGMFGGGDFGGGRGGFGGGGFGGGGFGGGGFGGGGFGGGRGGMVFGPPGAEGGMPGGMGGGPPGGNMTVTMGPPGGDGGRGGGRGRGGEGGGGMGSRGGGGPGMGAMGGEGGEGGGGDFGGGRGFGRGRGGEGGGGDDPTAALEGLFARADENQSGSLEKDEWDNLEFGRGVNVSGDDIDKDKDGIISRREFWETVSEKMRIKVDPSKYAWKPTGPMTYRAKDPKDKYPDVPTWFWNEDKNGDGQITMAERSSSWTDERVAKWMKDDTNGDGLISMQEAIASTKPAPTGIVMATPRVAADKAGQNAPGGNGLPQGDGGNGRGSRNNENAQAAPAIDADQAREMKADRSKNWDKVGSKEAGAAPSGGAAPSYDLPADLPESIDKAKAAKSARFFAQEDKNKDGFLSGEELAGNTDADKDKDGKASLKEWIIYKLSP